LPFFHLKAELSGYLAPRRYRQHELLAAAVREGDTPAAAVSIHMNCEGGRENFLQPAPPPSDGGARSSAGCAAAASFNLLTPQNIMGLTFVGAAGAAAQSAVNTAAAGAARRGRNVDLQSKGKHSYNAFRFMCTIPLRGATLYTQTLTFFFMCRSSGSVR